MSLISVVFSTFWNFQVKCRKHKMAEISHHRKLCIYWIDFSKHELIITCFSKHELIITCFLYCVSAPHPLVSCSIKMSDLASSFFSAVLFLYEAMPLLTFRVVILAPDQDCQMREWLLSASKLYTDLERWSTIILIILCTFNHCWNYFLKNF